MSERKLRTFEEKINRFLQKHELGEGRFMQKAYFLERYPYLPEEEIDRLLALCREIESTAYSYAKQVVDAKTLTLEQMRAALQEKYPFLDQVRLDRLIARTHHWAMV